VDLSAVPVHAPGVTSREIDGEAVLVDLQHGTLHVLNPVGARLWGLIDGERTVADLTEVLTTEYVIDLEHGRADVLMFCEDLLRRNVVIVAD
jgi:hypothetical protein